MTSKPRESAADRDPARLTAGTRVRIAGNVYTVTSPPQAGTFRARSKSGRDLAFDVKRTLWALVVD